MLVKSKINYETGGKALYWLLEFLLAPRILPGRVWSVPTVCWLALRSGITFPIRV